MNQLFSVVHKKSIAYNFAKLIIKGAIMKQQADIGVFGGSGFYSFLEDVQSVEINTPYGQPSDKIALAEIKGKKVAFLPRHGSKHQLPPHKINYLANLYAFKELGVKKVIGPCAAGSLQKEIKPGDFVVCDDLVDETKQRAETFFDGPKVYHIHMAEPYCPELRQEAIKAVKKNNIHCHETGTVVVINGPRFATKAESRSFSKRGFQVINMTQYPESYLAKELDMCYVNISLITDYDVGLIGLDGIKAAPVNDILRVFKENNDRLKNVLFTLIENMSIAQDKCFCAKTTEFSAMN
jgi:5'-methylthioadenosine phosphorylase